MIPFYIVSHNNGFLVRNTVNAIRKFALENPIIILDNNSTDKESLSILTELKEQHNVTVTMYTTNTGPWRVLQDAEFEVVRKQPFVLTDPDLELDKLPTNVLEVLREIQLSYKRQRVGLALDISQTGDILSGIYHRNKSIIDWESNFWQRPISDDKYQLYQADIDTTFCLYDYSYGGETIRVAGQYTVRHLPWHKSFIDSLPLSTLTRTFNNPLISTTAKLVWNYKKIIKVKDFLVALDGQNDKFWGIYPTWERETFQIFDRFATSNKNILDIGAWIGPTVLYNASRFKHVWSVDGDKGAIQSLTNSVAVNNFQDKITIIPKAVYKQSGKISFGKNLFLANSRTNDSTSQVYEGIDGGELVDCLSFNDLIAQYDIKDLALIKVDIEGGEEFIMKELLQYSLDTKIPIYLSFHFSWWKTKDLSKYVPYLKQFTCGDITARIIARPFMSVLMEPKSK